MNPATKDILEAAIKAMLEIVNWPIVPGGSVTPADKVQAVKILQDLGAL